MKRQHVLLLLGILTLLALLFLVEGWAQKNALLPTDPAPTTGGETPEEPPLMEQITIPIHPDQSSEKYMFRGAWLTSVRNLDFPPRPDMSEEELKSAYRHILDLYELHQLNAVIFQVRPNGDALYPSDLNPLSPYLATQEESSFDLLEFMITETHQRGMEFHAWFNPFRLTIDPKPGLSMDELLATLPERSHGRNHPQQVLRFSDRLLLDPGHPLARRFVIDSILEVVRRYDIDAVHLDDYFYPYPGTTTDDAGNILPLRFGDLSEDQSTFDTYGRPGEDQNAWRRSNVTTFIQDLRSAIRREKTWVKLGVSPFGIWGHEEETEGLGSDTPLSSMETYHHGVFADTRGWVKDGLIDYILPQIYWGIGEPSAPYDTLVAWWADTVLGTDVHLYVGHALYKLYDNQNSPYWQGEAPIKDQLQLNRDFPSIYGSAFFRFSYLLPDHPDFQGDEDGKAALQRNSQALRKAFSRPAVIPPMDHLPLPSAVTPSSVIREGNLLTFQDGWTQGADAFPTRYFLLYALPKEDLDPGNPLHLYKRIPVLPGKETYSVVLPEGTDLVYAVSAVNRMHVESPAVACIRP